MLLDRGGPGGPTPYRILVDTGVVLLCTLALAPSSPLVSLASLVYFVLCEPLWRRNLIFVYRPKFDAGGARWPYLFDMAISSLVMAEILLTSQMALKQALGPTVVAAVPILPTLWYQQRAKKKYKKAFDDAALLQTSLLDGWDASEASTEQQREEFRRFLVDAHKAAYVPVCIAGSDTDDFITAEPAVVVPLETDFRPCEQTAAPSPEPAEEIAREASTSSASVRYTQLGATMRRAVHTLSAMRQRNMSVGSSAGFRSVSAGGDNDFGVFDSPFSTTTMRRPVPEKLE